MKNKIKVVHNTCEICKVKIKQLLFCDKCNELVIKECEKVALNNGNKKPR